MRAGRQGYGEGVAGGVFFDDDCHESGGDGVAGELGEAVRESPVGFAREYLGVKLWSKQGEVLRAVRDYRRVAVKAGNGLGKGFTAAVAVLWFVRAFKPAVVLTTAPTERQVRHVLWREIRRLHRNSVYALGGRMLSTRLEIDEDQFALGLSTDEADQFQGFHSPNMLIVVDEAEGVSEDIYEAIDAVMTASNCKLLLIGNPTRDSGTFYRAFHEDRGIYHNITISALESPNVEERRAVIPGLTTHEWVEERGRIWGEDSAMYQARVLGQFCEQPQDRLIPLSKIEEAIGRHRLLATGTGGPSTSGAGCTSNLSRSDVQPAPFAQDERKEAGADGGSFDKLKTTGGEGLRTTGGDGLKTTGGDGLRTTGGEGLRTTGGEGSGRQEGRGLRTTGGVLAVDVARFGADQSVLLVAEGNAVLEVKAYRGLDTMELTGRVVEAHRRWSPERIVVDEIGIGAGVVDRLKELKLPVEGVNVGRPARKRELFANLRAEGYWRLYELFTEGLISIPNDAELAGQLSSLRPRQNSRGQLYIESKDDMRKRGLASPDKADALMLAFLRVRGRVRLYT